MDRIARLLLKIAYGIHAILPRLGRRRQGVAVAVWQKDRVLFVRHSYRSGYFLPGGNARRKETLREAARRELKEEVGIDAEPDALLPVYTTAWVRVYEYYPCRTPAIEIDNREIVEAFFAPPRDIATLPGFMESYLLSRVR
ncbi:MAG: NUDIX domain-containing protein [Planctomycetota bacterium]